MATHPETPNNKALAPVRRLSAGPKLIGLGVALFVVTRIVVWLPLGFVGSWINGLLWPVLILAIVAGAGLVILKNRPNASAAG